MLAINKGAVIMRVALLYFFLPIVIFLAILAIATMCFGEINACQCTLKILCKFQEHQEKEEDTKKDVKIFSVVFLNVFVVNRSGVLKALDLQL